MIVFAVSPHVIYWPNDEAVIVHRAHRWAIAAGLPSIAGIGMNAGNTLMLALPYKILQL